MSSIFLVIFFGFTAIIEGEISSEIDRVKEHLQNSAHQLPMTVLFKIPKPAFYLNSKLRQNAPHQLDLTKELTAIIPEWNPRILAFDPTCPYYFSKIKTLPQSDEDFNLLSYLHAIESNETVPFPFINVLPRSYHAALPLPSIFHCRELVHSLDNPFFHNIELILGPGQTELPLNRQSTDFSQFYCSLYGSPHFLLINQTKQPTITYNAETLLSQANLHDVDFLSTSLPPGTCLFIPSDWLIGVQLNNSISLLFTLKTLIHPSDDQFFSCTKLEQLTLDHIQFTIQDQLNISTIGLMIYFYRYLNPPMFDQEYTSNTFVHYFQADKNISQLVINWTPDLLDLIENKLFPQLDINHDDLFNIGDYFDIKQSIVDEIGKSLSNILEEIRRIILAQYNELSGTMRQIIKQSEADGLDQEDKETLISMIENLPKPVRENFKRNNINVNDALSKLHSVKSKPSSSKKQDGKKDTSSKTSDL